MKFKVLLYLCLLGPVKLGSSADVLVPLGFSIDLPCYFQLPAPVKEELLTFSWSFNGLVVASKNHTERGFHLNTTAFLNGSLGLTVYNVTPHQQGVYECSLSSNGTDYSSNVTLTVLAAPSLSVPSRKVVLGRESALECWVKGFSPPLITFSWTREGKLFRLPQRVEGKRTDDGLYQAVSRMVFVPELFDRNVTYGCVVQHEALEKELIKEFNTSMIIVPEVSVSIVPPSSHSSPLTLSCEIDGFSPNEVSVVWLQNGTVLSEAPQSQPYGDGRFRMQLFYTVSAEERERGGHVQCVAQQPGVSQPAAGSVHLSTDDPLVRELVLTKSAKASVAMMIISLILVLLLCFGFSWKRRDEKQKSLNVSAIILPPRVAVGQKGRVTISIEGRRADTVQTAWFLNDVPITDTSYTGEKSLGLGFSTGHTPRISRVSMVSEKGPLLPYTAPGYYKIHTRHPLHSSGPVKQMLSSITFIPNLSIHKGAVFKCQISYKGKDKIVMEKMSDKFTVLAPPDVSEIQLSEPNEETGVVTLTVTASHFHPDIITFRWFCEGGELCPVAAPPALASPRPDAQGFFSAMSQCRLPKAELERGQTTVWVTVHHISLKQPVTRKTRGFLKKPMMSEISCCPSIPVHPEEPPTLSCDITGFYPPNILVKWLRRASSEYGEDEEEEKRNVQEEAKNEEEVKGAVELWGPLQTHPRTFRATTILKEAENVLKEAEQGGEIVCRVEHCSLQEPIERVWKRPCFVPPSIPPCLSVNWRNDGVWVFSLRVMGGVPRPKLVWAAGGFTLSQLISREREQAGGGGERELLSVCALVKSEAKRLSKSQQNSQLHNEQDPLAQSKAEDSAAVELGGARPAAMDSCLLQEDKGLDISADLAPSYVNVVNMGKEGRRGEKEGYLKVGVEITHPALSQPVYRTWTEPEEQISS